MTDRSSTSQWRRSSGNSKKCILRKGTVAVIITLCSLAMMTSLVSTPGALPDATTGLFGLSDLTGSKKSVNETSKSLTFLESDAAVASDLTNVKSLPEWLQAYVKLNNHQSKQANPKFLRWRCQSGCGGTGDRISGVVQAFYMAMCNHRLLLLDWEQPAPLTRYLEPHLIKWNDKDAISSTMKSESIRVMDDWNNPLLIEPNKLSQDADVLDVYTNVWMGEQALLQSQCMQDYMKKYTDGVTRQKDLYRLAFWTLFRWSPRVLDGVAAIQQQTQLTSPYAAIHVRTGRGATFEDLVLETSNELTWKQFYACTSDLQTGLEEMCKEFGVTKKVPIYLAADIVDVKKQFLSWDKDIKTLPDMEIYHIDRTKEELLVNAEAAQLNIWNELKILTDSTCLVRPGKSKFSRMADWLPLQPRCSVFYNDCGPEKVAAALATVDPTSACQQKIV